MQFITCSNNILKILRFKSQKFEVSFITKNLDYSLFRSSIFCLESILKTNFGATRVSCFHDLPEYKNKPLVSFLHSISTKYEFYLQF